MRPESESTCRAAHQVARVVDGVLEPGRRHEAGLAHGEEDGAEHDEAGQELFDGDAEALDLKSDEGEEAGLKEDDRCSKTATPWRKWCGSMAV